MKKTIWANTIIYNEENFIWFAVMSVIDYVDKILIYDTGSTDQTVEIIEKIIKIKKDKIIFREVGKVDGEKFTKMRQAMLDESKSDWILILDGDEIWWNDSIKRLVNFINKNGQSKDAIVVPFYNLVGDLYHYQSEEAGQYTLLGQKGHLTIKAINKAIFGLHVKGPYGQEGFFDGDDKPVQEGGSDKLFFLNAPFLHMTHLKRSSKDGHNKFKTELGLKFPDNFKFPGVFYQDFPKIVKSPFDKRSKMFKTISVIKEPLLKIKRKFI